MYPKYPKITPNLQQKEQAPLKTTPPKKNAPAGCEDPAIIAASMANSPSISHMMGECFARPLLRAGWR